MRAAAAAILFATRLAAAEADYDLDNRDWNGLSELRNLATGIGLEVVASADVDWSNLSAETDALYILYPTATVDAVHLVAFVRAGGRVLLGDDFGTSDEALARMGLLRRPAHTVRARRFEGNPNLPIAVPRDADHPLARDVTELYTNHPAVLTAEGGAGVVFSFSGGDAVVVTGDLGTGRWVVLSDPSVLINAMLAFDGNLAFALNLVRYLRPTGARGRLIVLTQDFRLHGDPPAAHEAGSLNELLGNVGGTLDDLNDYVASEALLRALAAVGAALCMLGVALAWSRGRAPRQDATFARAAPDVPPVDWDDPATRNFALPAAVLRENAGDKAPFAHLPTRADLVTAFVSRRDFIDAYDAAQKMKAKL